MTETTEQTRKCSNCMWWEYLASDLGVCRGAPPQIARENGALTVLFPETYPEDWCGSFRMKEPGQ